MTTFYAGTTIPADPGRVLNAIREVEMRGSIGKLRELFTQLIRREPRQRPPVGEVDWLPPTLGASDLSSPYFLAMADRDAAWYFDHH
jgi:hypothetical protein